jgi:hypothetical protein
MSKRRDIFDAIKTQLTGALPWAKIVDWEKIRLMSSDFGEHEVPCVQFYALPTEYRPQQGRNQASMLLSVEVVIKSSVEGVVDQRDMFDRMEDVILAFGKNPNLGVAGVIHARLIKDFIDPHTIHPHFIGILTFEVVYMTTYTGC